jgi:ABC-2 type transport system permease protein
MTAVDETPRPTQTRSVPWTRALAITYRVVLRELATRGRIIALSVLAFFSTLAGFAVGTSDSATLDDGVRLIAGLGLAGVVPVVALVFGGASIGDLRDDKTLVYLWLRPMDRSPMAVGAALAALTLAAPITMIPLVAAALLTGVGGGIVGATALASAVGLIAYVAVFTMLGSWLKRYIVWGLAYILIWEGFIAQAGAGVARFALRKYTRSIMVAVTDVDLDLADFSLGVGIGVPLITAVAALAVATWRLAKQDIA